MRPARRLCSADPRCPNLSDGGPCRACRRKREQARPSSTARGYTAEWAEYSRRWLRLHRWCGERADFRFHAEDSTCTQRGDRVRATVTDHIRAIAQGGAVFDPTNHQSLCGGCNRRKAIAKEGAFSRV